MTTDISKLGNQELRQVYLQERVRFSNGLDQRLGWDQLKEICSALNALGKEIKKREEGFHS